jgi:hypothetical protein
MNIIIVLIDMEAIKYYNYIQVNNKAKERK